MKKSALVAAVGVLALAAALYVVVLPAWQERRDDQWQRAGERALARVELPSPFRAFRESTSGYLTLSCQDEAVHRCFEAEGDPRSNVAAVRAALTSVARGPLRESCSDEEVAGIPDRCSLVVPVADSRLVAFLFARPAPGAQPLSGFSGTYVQIIVESRDAEVVESLGGR